MYYELITQEIDFNSKRCDYEYILKAFLVFIILISIPKGAIMRIKHLFLLSHFLAISIPKGAIMRKILANKNAWRIDFNSKRCDYEF